MYVYVRMYVYVCMYVCMSASVYMYVYIYVCMFLHTYIHTYVCLYMCEYIDPPHLPLVLPLTSYSEPGYYETDNFGIRIENLMVVVSMPAMGEFGGRGKKKRREGRGGKGSVTITYWRSHILRSVIGIFELFLTNRM